MFYNMFSADFALSEIMKLQNEFKIDMLLGCPGA